MAVPERKVGPEVFLAGAKEEGALLLDARSPGEYAEAHIPGAQSFPLFDDAQRAEVGTLYKQVGREAAIERGLELIGPRMATFVREARALFDAAPHRRPIHLYCWRGGMRSGSLSGLPVVLLEGGYKAYKQTLPDFMGRAWPLVRVGGYTGSAKTAVLEELKQAGEQVVDLEGLACHFGSAFGNLRRHAQPSSEHFRNLLAETLTQLDPDRRIWVENSWKPTACCAWIPWPTRPWGGALFTGGAASRQTCSCRWTHPVSRRRSASWSMRAGCESMPSDSVLSAVRNGPPMWMCPNSSMPWRPGWTLGSDR